MGVLNNRPHSTRPIYCAIKDLPRDQRYHQVNVICAAIIPGPKEPNAQQINHCLEPSIRELIEVKNGTFRYECAHILMNTCCEASKCISTTTMNLQISPQTIRFSTATCQHRTSVLNGTAGHSHDFHHCVFCDIDIVKVNNPEGYDNCRCHPLAACLLIFCLTMQPGLPKTTTKCSDKVFIQRMLPRLVEMQS
jgi:hypothetical protein